MFSFCLSPVVYVCESLIQAVPPMNTSPRAYMKPATIYTYFSPYPLTQGHCLLLFETDICSDIYFII